MSETILERDPLSMNGQARFPGTRITVRIFLDYLAAGVSVDELCGPHYYPQLTVDQCHAVLDRLRYLADSDDGRAGGHIHEQVLIPAPSRQHSTELRVGPALGG